MEDTTRWGEWIVEELGLSGFRLDAVQHYSWNFADRWTQHLKKTSPNDLMCVGEFWNGNVDVLLEWMANMSPDFKLYDVPLMYKMARLSTFEDCDLRAVFQDTLVQRRPESAVVSSIALSLHTSVADSRRPSFAFTTHKRDKKWTPPSHTLSPLTHTHCFS